MAVKQSREVEVITIKPQEGFQEGFLSSSADVLIGGGAAGAGKTFALLLDVCRYFEVKGFGGVIFRRTTPQIRNDGALWDTSHELFPLLGGEAKETTLEWKFPAGPKLKFTHLEHEKNKYDHQGAQYAYIGFDELTHFTRTQFFYLLTRNRSTCGVPPCIRATCNPDPDSWLAEFISWWIDDETGFPIPERDGVLRYFTIDEGRPVWGDTKKEVLEQSPQIVEQAKLQKMNPEDMVKSATFIRGDVYGNKELLTRNPQYLANLMAQDSETKQRLLDGNWRVRQDNSALCDYLKVNDLFTNRIPVEYKLGEDDKPLIGEDGKKIKVVLPRKITCDAARFGRDMAVIKGWEGFTIKHIWVWTKSSTSKQVEEIEKMRGLLGCGKSDVLVDQDGVGGGVVDEGGYQGFSGGSTVMVDPQTKIKENYKDLKTQCYYRFAERRINEGLVAIEPDCIMVDGVKTSMVTIGKEIVDVEKLIKQDLRCFKRIDIDMDGKKRMNNKESQKIILGGRSPDFGDAMMLREWFELAPTSSFGFTKLG